LPGIMMRVARTRHGDDYETWIDAGAAGRNRQRGDGGGATAGGECAEGGGEPAVAINSPTEAYTFLFDAVKRKDTAAIKQISSKATREMAQIMNTTYKKTCEEAYKNGFTETAMQEKMPQIRDLRMEGDVAAMEVKNAKGAWEQVTFIKEGNGWKLALGDMFFGRIKPPGKSQTFREQENANARGLGNMPINPLANKNGANGNTFKAFPVPNEKIEKQMLKKRPGQPIQPGPPKQ